MSPMSYERGESVYQHLGTWQPSRAINPSDGMDPVSLGLVPSLVGSSPVPVERPTGPAPVTPAGTLPPGVALPAPFVDPTSLVPDTVTIEVPEPYASLMRQPPNQALIVDVAVGRVWLRGTSISLTPTEQSEVMQTVVRALERQQRDEILSLRAEYALLPPDPGRSALPEANDTTSLVHSLPSPHAAAQPAESRSETSPAL